MSDDNWPTFFCEYGFEGERYVFYVPARNLDEAKRRIKAMAWGQVKGTHVATIPVPGGDLWLRLRGWFRELFP